MLTFLSLSGYPRPGVRPTPSLPLVIAPNVSSFPQGVKFEPSSFKLTHEMVILMGGPNSAGYRQFTELTVKAFLACRPYGQDVVDTAALMTAAEFPSYKDEGTMPRLKERFRLDLSEREAAEYMMSVINNAYENKVCLPLLFPCTGLTHPGSRVAFDILRRVPTGDQR